MGAEPKHIAEVEAANPKTNETCLCANASEEMIILSLVFFIVNHIEFEAMIVISQRVIY